MNRSERRDLNSLVRRITGRKIADIAYPGGKSRNSYRLTFEDGTTAIATRRRSSSRSAREIDVMRTLDAHGGPVPRVLAVRNGVMLQQDLGQTRLSEHLHEVSGDPEAIGQALDRAADAMGRIHEAAAAAGLADRSTIIGAAPEWIEGLVKCPVEIEAAIGLKVPAYPTKALTGLLRVRKPSFVKWDSRPGNALLRDGDAYWFDWEHSGARNAPDDLVWLLCDEFVTFKPDMLEAILNKHLPRFDGAFASRDEAMDYFAAMATFHTIIRLGLILRNKGDGPWWSMSHCLEGDKVGVTRRCARRLVWRGMFWADRLPDTRPLVGFFRELETHFEAASNRT